MQVHLANLALQNKLKFFQVSELNQPSRGSHKHWGGTWAVRITGEEWDFPFLLAVCIKVNSAGIYNFPLGILQSGYK